MYAPGQVGARQRRLGLGLCLGGQQESWALALLAAPPCAEDGSADRRLYTPFVIMEGRTTILTIL